VTVLPLPGRYRRAHDPVDERAADLRYALIFKRIFDLVVSLALLAILSPLFLLILIGIPLDSPGSPIFRHKRVGMHGRVFRIYKFRTMTHHAHSVREQMVVVKDTERLFFKHKRDPRVTRFGRFLRKFSLDELPQLINVLKGDMSLIGPRPLLKEDFFEDAHPSPLFKVWVRDRHRLWPGITGLWQVSGRSDLSWEDSVRLDLYYVENWSLVGDMLILWKTFRAVVSSAGAY
jgi:lipopolysaccharide/colanic/teichoic acid biosynthesis glycosyltransferase